MLSNGKHISMATVSMTTSGYLLMPQDHEERPAIDVIPTTPTPQWHDAFPVYTHNSSWTDADGINHSMTLRS